MVREIFFGLKLKGWYDLPSGISMGLGVSAHTAIGGEGLNMNSPFFGFRLQQHKIFAGMIGALQYALSDRLNLFANYHFTQFPRYTYTADSAIAPVKVRVYYHWLQFGVGYTF